MKTEINNKNKILSYIKPNNKKNMYKQKSSCDSNNNNKKLKPIHQKPEKPIDYLKILEKEREENKKSTKDIGVGKMSYNIEEDMKNKNNGFKNIEDLELAKSKCDAIDKKILEKKIFLRTKGGYIMNTNLGDEIGHLLIKSIRSKLNILKNK